MSIGVGVQSLVQIYTFFVRSYILFVYLFNDLLTMDSSKVELLGMTGPELQMVCSISGIDMKDIPGILGISYGTMYNYFKRQKQIPEEVEAKIDGHPDLAKAKNQVIKRPETGLQTKQEGNEVVKLLSDTIQVMRDLLVKSERRDESITKAIDALSDDNATLRKLVNAGIDSGALQWKNVG